MTSKLRPGGYELKDRVDNPGKADRRHIYDWRKHTHWPKGYRLIVREE